MARLLSYLIILTFLPCVVWAEQDNEIGLDAQGKAQKTFVRPAALQSNGAPAGDLPYLKSGDPVHLTNTPPQFVEATGKTWVQVTAKIKGKTVTGWINQTFLKDPPQPASDTPTTEPDANPVTKAVPVPKPVTAASRPKLGESQDAKACEKPPAKPPAKNSTGAVAPLDWSDYESHLKEQKVIGDLYKTLAKFNCTASLTAWKSAYSKNIKDFQTKRTEGGWESKFSPEARQKVFDNKLVQPTFEGFAADIKTACGPDRFANTFLLSETIREVQGSVFQDEKLNGTASQYRRKGSGPFQLTAEAGKNGTDYSNFNKLRAAHPNSIPKGWEDSVPLELKVETRKSQIDSYQKFKESPYNARASIWYAREHTYRETNEFFEREFGAEEWKALPESDRLSLLGVFYNGGIGRMKCATKRFTALKKLKIPGKPTWAALRPLLYLEKNSKETMPGVVQDNFEKLQNICSDKSCVCADQEKNSDSDHANDCKPFVGKCKKAAIMLTYGDALPKYEACFKKAKLLDP